MLVPVSAFVNSVQPHGALSTPLRIPLRNPPAHSQLDACFELHLLQDAGVRHILTNTSGLA
jgi:hypothetical protein